VNSMSDLFHEEVPDSYVLAVARVMALANWHTYQVLTKRAERLAALLHGELGFAAGCPNIWWGVSVEDRRYGLPRISRLREAPATVRFLSNRSSSLVRHILEQERRVPYDEIWDAAMAQPMTWESDLKDWLQRWHEEGLITHEGWARRQRVPHLDEGNVVVWL
jgi:Protein of unknown function (DUF5131)